MKIIKYFIAILLISCTYKVSAQSRTLSGTVRGNDGPVVGANVSEKNNPQNGTMTGVGGTFQLNLPIGSNVLVVSSVGFLSQEINVGTLSNVNVTLEIDSKGIDEVIVVGFGTQKRFTNTGAVASVTREEILQTPSASIQNALTGKLPGFFTQQRSGMPGSDGAQFFVRGVSTFTGNQQPLILVDDIEYSYDQFSTIDPNEVESISILKDAATTAVYGIKGANGVVLVTTRRGKEGPTRINFRSEYGIQKPTHVPQFLNAYQTALLHNEALRNDGVDELTSNEYFRDSSLNHFLNGTDPYGHPDVDWYNTLFRSSAPMMTNNFDISGGAPNVQYMVSMGYLRQNGMLRQFNAHKDEIDNGYYYNRYNFRSNLDVKATKTLDLRLDISGNFGERNNPYFHGNSGAGEIAVFSEVARFTFLNPYMYPIYNPDGSWGYGGPSVRGTPFNNSNNIIGRIAHGGYTRVRQNLLNFNLAGTQKLDALTKGLALRAAISSTNANSSQRQILRRDFPSYYYYYDPVNKEDVYTPRDVSVHRVLPWETTYSGGNPRRQVNIQANLTYARRFGNHNTSALLLFNQTSKVAPDSDDPLNHYIPDNFRGYTIRAGYDYKQKYLLEVNAGYNGTDKFVSQNRYALFPAVSVGWNMGEERFMRDNLSFVELFKFRGSYGIVGSDDIGGYRYAYEEVYNRESPYSFGESHNNFVGITEGFLGNDAIIWEKERKANMGLDFSFFKGRLSGALDVFHNHRSDILTVRNTIPANFGVDRDNLPPVNIGQVSNRGYEVEIRYRTKFNDFGLDIKGNYSYAKNKIIEMDEVEPRAIAGYGRQTVYL